MWIARTSDGRRWAAPSQSVIGRSSVCALELEAADVSKEHASLRWDGIDWGLRDLNSRNGTFVSGKRLGPEQSVRLEPGLRLRFGATESWIVESIDAPVPMARRLEDGEFVHAAAELLTIPSDDEPIGCVYRDADGRWLLEHEGEVQVVENESVAHIGGHSWRLFLPSPQEKTAEPGPVVHALAAARLRFEVSLDEEHVKLTVVDRHRTYELKDRAHHYPILILARLRRRDAEAGVPEAECGWVNHRDLERMLSMTRSNLNVAVHRTRKQLEAIGFADAASCIERRLVTGQLRLGIPNFEIHRSVD